MRAMIVGVSAAALVFTSATPALAVDTTLSVCDDGCAYTTIQSAVDAAITGDTISIGAGTYAEEVSIDTAGISLIGAGQNATIIVPARNYSADNRGISIEDAGNLTIRDLTVDGAGNSVLAAGENFHDGIWWSGGGDNTVIQDVTVRNIDRRGISVFPETVTNTLISGVTVENVSGAVSGNATGHGIMMHGSGTIENTRVHAAKYAIGGNNAAPSNAPVVVRNSTITGLTGIDTGMFNIGINFWIKNDGKVTITGNSIAGSADRNGGIYLVDPGVGSTISDNTITLGGSNGLGIELSWAATAGVQVTDNSITLAEKSTGILATGSGTSADPTVIKGNVISNSSTAGPVENNNYTNYGPYQQREVGIIVSAEPATSRTGDTMMSTYATVTDNVVSGYTNAIAYIEDIDGAYDLAVTTTANDFRSTGAAAVHGVIDGATNVAASFAPIAADDADFAAINAENNYWGTNTPDFGALLVGSIDATPWVTAAVEAGPPAPAPAANTAELEAQIRDLGLDVAATTGSFSVTGDAAGQSLASFPSNVPLSGTLPWSSSDDFVDVYAYSTPVFLGSFPVVNGAVQLNGLDLSALGLGAHNLVFVGQSSGVMAVMAFELSQAQLAMSGAAIGATPLVGLLLLLIGGALVVARRKRAIA